jgi:hypothetical protein
MYASPSAVISAPHREFLRVKLSTILYAIIPFALCSVAVAIRSRGFLESDGGTHFLMARHAFEQPAYFVDVWGRPLCTGLFAVPAKVAGLVGVRMASLCMAIGCGLVALRIATIQQYQWPALALIFTLGQPLVFFHSFSELTELPFALVIGLAFLGYCQRRWWLMAVFAAISPLGRPEGFGFLLLAAIALVLHRQWKWLVILPVGLVGWSLAGHLLTGPADAPWWRWIADHWPYEARSEYPSGSLFHFVMVLPVLVAPFAMPALFVGISKNVGTILDPRRLVSDHAARVDWLIAALPLGILLIHSVLFRLGRFSSNGSLRYLLIVAPFWGLLCARGWATIFQRFQWKQPLSWAALAIVMPGVVNWVYPFMPIKQSQSWAEAEQVVRWYRQSPERQKYPRIMSNHPGVYFYTGDGLWDRSKVEPWTGETIDHPPAGVILLWDPEFCVRNSDARLVAPLARVLKAGWIDDSGAEDAALGEARKPGTNDKLLGSQQLDPQQWHIFISPRK